MRKALLVAIVLCFATACGSKGPLYLPESKPAKAKAPAKPAAPASTESDEKRQAQ